MDAGTEHFSVGQRRRPSVSPYAHSRAIVRQFLDAQTGLGSRATIKDTARHLGASASVFHGARLHVEAVEHCGADPWMPREMAKRMLREKQASQPTEAANLIQSAFRALDQLSETLVRFDPVVLAGWLNQRTSSKRTRVRRAISRLRPWLQALEEGLR